MDLFARSVLQRLYSLKSEVMAGLSHSAFPNIIKITRKELNRRLGGMVVIIEDDEEEK